eukprot:g8859.t1
MVYVSSFTPVGDLFALQAGSNFLLRRGSAGASESNADAEATASTEEPRQGAQQGVDGGTQKSSNSGWIYVVFGHRLNMFMCVYIGVNHLLAFHAIFLLTADQIMMYNYNWTSRTTVQWQTLLFALLLWPISGLGITAGAHRLWSHRSYDAHAITRFFLMICNSMANQGSIYHWARDHRTHHMHSDTAADPHDSSRGWFYSHMGWLLVEKPEQVRVAGRKVDLRDLQKDAFVMFQKKTDPWWNFAWCFAVPALVAALGWGETLWNGFLYAGVLRIVHSDGGPSPYDPAEAPSESRLVSFLAMGEGWHSWHHAFAFDYATAELDCWQQWNPTKMFIDLMAALGLVTNRKRGHRMWGNRKQQMRDAAQKEGKVLVETLSGPPLCKVRNIKRRLLAPHKQQFL